MVQSENFSGSALRPSRKNEQGQANESSDSEWIAVDVESREDDEKEEDDQSLVEVSRASSPLTISFNALRLDSPSTQVLWPESLPWLRFQDHIFQRLSAHEQRRSQALTYFFLPPGFATSDVLYQLHLNSTDTGAEKVNNGASIISSQQLKALATSAGYKSELARMNNFMPQEIEGDNAQRLKALVTGDPLELKRESLLRFVHQLSNNLIDDQAETWEGDEDEGQDFDEMGEKTIRIFRSFDLPLAVWKRFISETLEQPTGRAFRENLFEAAANTNSLDICEILLELGADPDRLIMTGSCHVQRPVQLAVEYWVRNVDFLKLLIRFGADVNLVCSEDSCPALFKAAKECTLEAVQALVDAGANLRVCIEHKELTYTALAAAVESDWRHSHQPEEELELNCCRIGVEMLNYLLPKYNREDDHEIIQSALVMAASCGRNDMTELLLRAGANASETSAQGYTPLICAVHHSYKSRNVPLARQLLEDGADPNMGIYETNGIDMGPIHIAAQKGEEKMIELLIDNGAHINTLAYSATNTEASYSLDSEDDGSEFGRPGEAKGSKTALQLALVPSFSKHHTKSGDSALVLIRAGAIIKGDEFASATAFNNLELMQELLLRGADVNGVDPYGRNALQRCLEHKNVDLVAYLLEAGISVQGENLIQLASKIGNRQIIELLLDHGAPTQLEESRESLLAAAAASKNWELMTWFMDRQELPYNSLVLCRAVTSGIGTDHSNEPHLKALLRQRPRNPNTSGDILEGTALAYAAFWNQQWLIGHLLAFKHDGNCILPLSGDLGYYNLLEAPSQLKRSFRTQMKYWDDRYAIRCSIVLPFILANNWQAVRRLMRAGYRPDRLSLLVAIKSQPLPEIKHLTSHMHGIDISEGSRGKLETPLQAAIRWRRRDVIQHLLGLGVDVNALPASEPLSSYEDEERIPARTALQQAVASGDLDTIDLLLDAGAEVNAPATWLGGATALQIAAATGQIGVAKKLLALGADINATGAAYDGRTALAAAAERGRLDMVQFLLESGVIWHHYDAAMDKAKVNGHTVTMEIIRAWKQSK